MQMQSLGIEGLPYIHMRTFDHWKDAGRQVRKGEKAKVVSVVWIPCNDKNDSNGEDDGSGRRMYP